MTRSLQWRFLLILAVVVGAVIFAYPTFVKESPSWWPSFFPKEKIHLGLDLQGGMQLTYEVKMDAAVDSTVEQIKNDLKAELRKKEIFSTSLERVQGNKIEVILLNPDVKGKFDDYLKEQYPNLKEVSAQKQGDRVRVLLEMDPRQIAEIKKSAVEQALETIRNRVDQFGVAEPDISRQGENEILIQLPDIDDPERAKDLIGKTALLEFKLVDEDADLGAVLAGNVPFGDALLYQRVEDPETGAVRKIPYVIKDKTLMTGNALKDARVSLGQNNMPYIGLSFHPAGARDFEQITTENVGRRLAIILDNNVYSAPVIKQPISGGAAVIEGRFSLEEARDLSNVLRNSLKAPIEIIEERTVGPSLGQDSINNGIKATIIGGLLVILAMMAYYRMAGFVANIALALNMLLLLAAMAVLPKVLPTTVALTLPGIAGIALTLGMAVDANVLIFERIREEMRLGKPPGAALEAGYTRAFLTIMDSNVTTVIAALVLLQFGTGPVKGFAITLTIGIAASMFTAIVVTRFIFDFVLHNIHVKRWSI